VYESNYRPIPLSEYLVFGNEIYDEHGRNTAHIPVSDLKILKDPVINATVSLVWGCVAEDNSALVFCSTKDNSETMAVSDCVMEPRDWSADM
jgi:replicative superfamily II helicase